MRLFYSENIISHTRAVIFINDGINRMSQIDEAQFIKDKQADLKAYFPEMSQERLDQVVDLPDEVKEEEKRGLYVLEIPEADELGEEARILFEDVLEFK